MQVATEIRDGRLTGSNGPGYLFFGGIPYAAAPTGRRRFGAPESPVPWTGTRDAREFGAASPQVARRLQVLPTSAQGRKDEDCLFLNVWTPATDEGRRPVLVFVHGGSFQRGDGASPIYAGPPLVARAGAVVVTLNYRLGAFGFVNLRLVGGDRLGAAANPGLLDQIAALRWVKENIDAFGGDPDNVTLCGESAGAMSVGALLGMPGAKGLFQRVVLQSGAAHNVHSEAIAERAAQAFLRALDLEPHAVERLWDLPVDRLLEAQVRVQQAHWDDSLPLLFQPSIDPHELPEPPLDAVARGAHAGLPMLIGTNRDEWNFFGALDPSIASLTESQLLTRMEARVGEGAELLVETYRRTRPRDQPGALFCALETDRVFRVPAIRLAEAQARHAPRTFAYLFTQESPALDGRLGSCHALELPFVFGHTGHDALAGFVGTAAGVSELSHKMMDAWTAFMQVGVPAHAGLPDWRAYEPRQRATLVLGTPCEAVTDPARDERQAWEKLI